MAGTYILPPPPPGPPAQGLGRGTKIALWSCGGCALVVALLVVGALVFGGVAFSRMFNLQVGNVKAPGDFPVYPGAHVTTSFKMDAKNSSGASVALVQWQSDVDSGKVGAWYREHLNQGDWELVSDSPRAAAPGAIVFRRRSTGSEGVLMVQGQLTRSVIQLEMRGDQPLERGAAPPSIDATPVG